VWVWPSSLLLAAAKLGQSGLDVWSIIDNILTSDSSTREKSSGGIDAILEKTIPQAFTMTLVGCQIS